MQHAHYSQYTAHATSTHAWSITAAVAVTTASVSTSFATAHAIALLPD
jgi:hypothetical protein